MTELPKFDYDQLTPDELKAIKQAESRLDASRKRVAELRLEHVKFLADNSLPDDELLAEFDELLNGIGG